MPEIILPREEFAGYLEINRTVPGYSDLRHYDFFTRLLQRPINSLLMLGVYFGRDICFLKNILKFNHPDRELIIAGVDKFDDKPCDDWSAREKLKTWEGNGFGKPPSWMDALGNVYGDCVTLYKMNDAVFLGFTGNVFDCIYLDTAHDEPTVLRQIQQCRRITTPESIICGDDWLDRDGWGVKSAVQKSFKGWEVFHDRIWLSKMSQLQ